MSIEEPDKKKKKKTISSKKEILKDAFENFGRSLEKTLEEGEEKRKEKIKEGIMQIEKKFKKELSSSRLASKRVSELRGEVGMSEKIGVSGKKPKLFGKDKFLEELAHELLAMSTSNLDGVSDMMPMEKVLEKFKVFRPGWQVNLNDLRDAIKLLSKKNIIPPMQVINKKEFVFFKPLELSSEINAILSLVPMKEKAIKISDLRLLLDWPEEKLSLVLKKLEELGIMIFDEESETCYFPGLE